MASFTAHYTLHITPCTVHPAQCTLHCTLHIACTMHHGRLPGHLCPLPHQAPRLWPRLTALVQSAPAAFIEAMDRSVSAFSGGGVQGAGAPHGAGGQGSSAGGPCWAQTPAQGRSTELPGTSYRGRQPSAALTWTHGEGAGALTGQGMPAN